MNCDICCKNGDYELATGGGICEECFQEYSYHTCNDCGCADTSDNIYSGYCESCFGYHDKPEWMGNEDEYYDSYDPDRD